MVVDSFFLNWTEASETAVRNPTLAWYNEEERSSFLTNLRPAGLALDLTSSTSFLPESFTISLNLEHQSFTSVINLMVRQEKRLFNSI